MSFRPSKRRHARHLEEEISLTSLMDMITILVVFLLVTAVFAKTAVIDTYLPQEGEAEVGASAAAPAVLVINVTETGFELGGLGEEITIPKRGGNFDFRLLTTELIKLKDRYPDKEEAILLFSPNTLYDTVIKVMDAARETTEGSRRKLFPMASLGESR